MPFPGYASVSDAVAPEKLNGGPCARLVISTNGSIVGVARAKGDIAISWLPLSGDDTP